MTDQEIDDLLGLSGAENAFTVLGMPAGPVDYEALYRKVNEDNKELGEQNDNIRCGSEAIHKEARILLSANAGEISYLQKTLNVVAEEHRKEILELAEKHSKEILELQSLNEYFAGLVAEQDLQLRRLEIAHPGSEV